MIRDCYSASKRPMCIASVRVEALRASGLRAAAAQRISSLYEEERISDAVRKEHSECLQGTGISYSSNASSSSSSSLPSSIRSPSLQDSFHPSMEKCFVAHSDPHYSVKSPSSWSMHDGLSSCGGRVYKRRKPGENVMEKHIHATCNSRKAFDETSTDENHGSLLSSSMKMIHSDAISDARVFNQVSGQETQVTKGMKHSLDVNDRRFSLDFGKKALGKDNCIYQAPGQANLPEEFGKYIEKEGSTFSYSKADDERVHTRFPFSLVVNDRRSSLTLGEKAVCKYNPVYKIPEKTKPQEDNIRVASSLGVNDRRSSSILSKKNFHKDDNVYEAPDQTKLPEELGKCIHQQISTHNYVNLKENNIQSLCPSSLDENHGRSSLVHGKRVLCKDYRIPQKTMQPEKQGIRQQVSTYIHTKVRENSVHSIIPASSDVNDRKSSTVLGKRTSCKDDSVYKTSGQTKLHEESGKCIYRQDSTHSYAKKKGYSFHSTVLIKDAEYNSERKQCNKTLTEKDDTGLCSQIALEAIEMMMHSTEMKANTNNIHLVEVEDIGPNTQIALEAIDLMMDDTGVRTKKIHVDEKEGFSISNQMTVEGKTLMRHGSNTKLDEHNMSVEANTQITLNATNTIRCADISCEHHVQQDTTNSCGEDMDIGANTQIALEAMDLMMSNTKMNETTTITCNSHAANGHEVDMEIGVNTQIALEAMDLMIRHNTMPETTSVAGYSQAENFHGEDLDISANTQIALEAMDLMTGHSTMSGTVSVKGKSRAANTDGEVVGTGAVTQMDLEAMDPMMGHVTSEIASLKGSSPTANAYGEDMDIGANTQVALEVMGLMMGNTTKNEAANVTGNSNAENLFGEDVDIGADTQIALEAMDLMIGHTTKNEAACVTGNSNAENLFGKDVDIGADTQIALEAMDLMIGHTTKNEAACVTGNSNAENLFGEDVDIGADTQIALEAMDLMISHTMLNETPSMMRNAYAANTLCKAVDIGADPQYALEGMDPMVGNTLMNDDSNHNLGMVEVLPSDVATSIQSDFKAINTMGDGNVKNPNYMETEKEKQKSIRVGPRKVKQQSLNKDMKSLRDGISREKKPPVRKGKRNALGQHMAINSKMSSDLDMVEESCASKSSTFVSVDKGKTPEAVLPKTREDFSCRKDSPFCFLALAIPKRKRSQRRSLVISSSRNTLVIQQDGENKICKPGFGKRIHPQKHDDKKQKLSILAGLNEGVLSEKTKEVNTLEPITNNARRKTRKREPSCIRVLFSHSLANDIVRHQKKILTRLGGQTANEAADSTHFISDAFVRTKNMLESIASGKNIVTTLWLEACDLAHYFVDEKNYILRDLKKEKELGFCMHSSLAASRQKPLLEGMSFIVSPNTVPDFEGMSAIIKSAGGQIMKNVRSGIKGSKSTPIVIASKEDFEFCASFLKRGIRVYSTEFILHGIIVQSLDFSRNHLFNEHY